MMLAILFREIKCKTINEAEASYTITFPTGKLGMR